jgi:hypothetical protein
MKKNPSISELQNSEKYTLFAEMDHLHIREFVLDQIRSGNRLMRMYWVYQCLMIGLGIIFIGLSVVKAFRGEITELCYSLAALVFSFSFLVVLHELLHGVAFKAVGVPRVTYGAIPHKFIFYAEADRFVLNHRQFRMVALAPLLTIQLVSLAGIAVFFSHPALWFFVIVMSLHSLFCAGDIAMLSFMQSPSGEVYTYDNKKEKKSYYFRKKT